MKTKKNNQAHQVTYLFGINPILESLRAHRRKIVCLYSKTKASHIDSSIRSLCTQRSIPIKEVPATTLTRLAGNPQHQGLVALTTDFPYQKKFFDPQHAPLLLLLDGIQDERNLGALLRSAYCTGINGVILTTKKSALYSPVACKSSAGFGEHLALYQTPTSADIVPQLKKAGYHLYLTTFDGINLLEATFTAPLCIIIGSEGEGINKKILREGI
ncbi:MAG: RNA methyltransferase, partial [Candidatus Babeliales bacterium]